MYYKRIIKMLKKIRDEKRLKKYMITYVLFI